MSGFLTNLIGALFKRTSPRAPARRPRRAVLGVMPLEERTALSHIAPLAGGGMFRSAIQDDPFFSDSHSNAFDLKASSSGEAVLGATNSNRLVSFRASDPNTLLSWTPPMGDLSANEGAGAESRRDINDIFVFRSPTNPAAPALSGYAPKLYFRSADEAPQAGRTDALTAETPQTSILVGMLLPAVQQVRASAASSPAEVQGGHGTHVAGTIGATGNNLVPSDLVEGIDGDVDGSPTIAVGVYIRVKKLTS